MGITKSELFNERKNRLANMFKVLAHPARLAILQYIIDQNECICTDLVEELGLAQATISQHLRELKDSGVIRGTIEGRSVCYCIDEEVWSDFYQDISTFFDQSLVKKNCC